MLQFYQCDAITFYFISISCELNVMSTDYTKISIIVRTHCPATALSQGHTAEFVRVPVLSHLSQNMQTWLSYVKKNMIKNLYSVADGSVDRDMKCSIP